MKFEAIMIWIMVLGFVATACTPASGGDLTEITSTMPITGTVATESIPETQSPATPLPTETLTTVTQAFTETPTRIVGSNEMLMVNNEGTTPFLADDQGRSLYVYSNDTQESTTSTCIDDCAVEWPPLTVKGTPAAGPGVDPALLGSISRDDGSIQATYNGWPLYYYMMDTIPGTTFGQSYNGVWFLLSPLGEPIQ